MIDYPAILRELNSRILQNPAARLRIIQEFYQEMVETGQGEAADHILTVRSMIMADHDNRPISPSTPLEVPPLPPGAPLHVKSATPLFMIMIVTVGVLGLAIIGGGIYAIYKNSLSETKMNIMGIDVSTGHVGVALVGLGIAMLIIVFRSITANIYKLAALPSERQLRKPKPKP